MKATVAVLRSSPTTILEDYEKLLALAGVEQFLDTKSPTILKNNISWHFPFLSANTTPWQLEGTIRGLKRFGYSDLVAVENKTVVTNAYKGERLNKYSPIHRKYDVPVLYNFKESDMKWIRYVPKGKMKILPHIYPEGIYVPDFFFGKNIVHLPTVKTHIYTTTTGAMKNAFGGLLNTKRHYTHSVIHETLVDLLMIQKEIHPGIFAVMDGTICGNGPGPRTMYPEEKSLILASGDQVAIDAVAAKIMGFDPLTIPYLRSAHERGLGIADPSQIKVVGLDIGDLNFGFSVGDNTASLVGDLLWFGRLKALQRLLFHTPVVNLFVMGSFLYHDYVWWPLEGKRRMAQLRKRSTGWAQLFDNYPE